MIPEAWIEEAQQRIGSHLLETPLTHDVQRGLYVKWENQQITGSFKARGALNKVLSLEDWERRSGLVAASAGNHGQGVALAGRLTACLVDVFVPEHAAAIKVQAMKELGATVHLVDGSYEQAESSGREYARSEQKTFVSPYNDGQVIAGQATLAREIARQLSVRAEFAGAKDGGASTEIASWIVPTGAGGLISGCGAVTARLHPRPKLIGVQPAASAFAHSLYYRNTQAGVEDLPTLAEGLSGPVEVDSVTIPMMQEFVDAMLIVSEEAIGRAIAFAWQSQHQRIEGSGAVGLAAILEGLVPERPCVVIVTGGNIDKDVFDEIIVRNKEARWN
jgi:threonine dehydratase